eukprot:1592976-Pyramimonas_sp.AAC.1
MSEGATGSILVFGSQDNGNDCKCIIVDSNQSSNMEMLLGDSGDMRRTFAVQFCHRASTAMNQAR